MKLFQTVISYQIDLVKESKKEASLDWKQDLDVMEEDLIWIKEHKPVTFHQALQLFWLYALCAGCINYGRMDMVLGPYLKKDMDAGRLTEEKALEYIASLWKMIENRRTTVNEMCIRDRPKP